MGQARYIEHDSKKGIEFSLLDGNVDLGSRFNTAFCLRLTELYATDRPLRLGATNSSSKALGRGGLVYGMPAHTVA